MIWYKKDRASLQNSEALSCWQSAVRKYRVRLALFCRMDFVYDRL